MTPISVYHSPDARAQVRAPLSAGFIPAGFLLRHPDFQAVPAASGIGRSVGELNLSSLRLDQFQAEKAAGFGGADHLPLDHDPNHRSLCCLLVQLAEEVALIYKQFEAMLAQGQVPSMGELQRHPLLASLIPWIGGYVDLGKVDLVGGLASALKQVSLFFLRHSSSLVGELLHLISNFLVMLFTMFFLFRDGSRLHREVEALTPMSQDYQGRIIATFSQVASATVIGSLLTAVTQGLAGD